MAFVITIEDGDRNTIVDLYTTHDVYLLPDGSEMFIRSEAAWCRSCARFTLAERFNSRRKWNREPESTHEIGLSIRC
jgi:hypothetical protein